MGASRSLICLCLHSSRVAARPALRQASTILPRTAPCQTARSFTSSPVLFKKSKASKSKKEDELDDGIDLPKFTIEPQGRQNPALLDNLKIELPECALQLKDVAMASLKDGETMLVSVFEEEVARNKMAAEISKIGESSKTVLKRARQDALKLLKSAQLPKDANKEKEVEVEVEKVMKEGSDGVMKIVEATKKAVLQ
ncbi:hypothetical protein SAICODRAFT_31586 [Saitoella complicata NRRL Y-17804]|uniref:uncharacterized protein n=1 Tax=Saitoella complicata (strain BCRC 22490 / CBS 7301 / JCM 7358 / NBRC 10748 / NRRL Y-17804) TaxID=698492 RepID=UPI0008671B48|nr:uncharacterized protein SAICODRAFT_31586 [Saitoella complicata NRRL Y-17804]ODQ51114.1 hypothetical protein SAICODRAFT_31586 [Saitoella complicata NRRL Y-17804]